jgi:serine/threonine protein kinase/tetratricopeptide (TPR) repeat protein
MPESVQVDEQLIQRLPLPLAQLVQRAQNGKNALERHNAAYYLWEASLKLLASTAIVEYAGCEDHDPQIADRLKNLARPMMGHWWEFVRRLVPILADAGDPGFSNVRDLLLGRARDDLPRTAALDAALREVFEGRSTVRPTVVLAELFDRLVQYRNREFGHGANGLRSEEFYDRMGRALLAGVAQLLERLDVLAGRRLLFVGEVRRQASGDWLVERFELIGESARRLESLLVPEMEAARLPRPEQVEVAATDRSVDSAAHSLHPMVLFDPDTLRAFFLNTRRGQRHAEYLCYTTGETLKRPDVGTERRELLARVLGILVESDEAEAWAARSLNEEPSSPRTNAAAAPRTLGEFELLSRLGRGGMGIVYRAWQPSLGRQVALKTMLRGDDPKAEQRFNREIRALGRVEHPGVVKVYTSGVDGETWYYAMELIDGADLARVCERLASSRASDVDDDRWHTAVSSACEKARAQETPISQQAPQPSGSEEAGTDAPAPPAAPAPTRGGDYLRRVVDIIRQAAEAVHELHEADVVHRDIKPGNIMLTAGDGHPVLMDLGLAQISDEAEGRITKTRQFVGTLRYASPEQILAVGRIDRRSDVYSLGATLWELLTLQPLYGATDDTPTPELMQRIATTDPERPRKLNPKVPRDLEAIVLKCLERDPSRRYATAADFAADLDRFLRGEPVVAHPPSLSYLASKFVRRHRLPIGVAASILLLLIAGTVIAFFRINAERARAEASFADARRTVGKFLVEISQEGLKDVPGIQGVRERFAREAADRYARYAADRPDDRSVAEGRARALASLGSISGQVGSVTRATGALEDAIRMMERLVRQYPDEPGYALQLARSRYELGVLHWSVNQFDTARPHLQRAIQEIEALAVKSPTGATRDCRFLLARSYNSLGNCQNEEDKQRQSYARSQTLYREILNQDPKNLDSLRGLAAATHNLAQREKNAGNYAGALELFNEDQRLSEAACKLAPQSPGLLADLGIGLGNKALVLMLLKRPEEALKCYQESVASHRSAAKDNPMVSRYQWLLADSLRDLAAQLSGHQKYAEAQALYEESAEILEMLNRRVDDRPAYGAALIDSRLRLAEFNKLRPDVSADKAEVQRAYLRDLDQAVQTARALSAKFPEDPELNAKFVEALDQRALYEVNAQRDQDAHRYFEECVETFRTRVCAGGRRPDDFQLGEFLKYVTEAVECAKRLKRTDDILRLAHVALEAGKGCQVREGQQDLAFLLSACAGIHTEALRIDEAIQSYLESVQIATPALEKAPWQWYLRQSVGGGHMHLAELYQQKGDVRNEVLAWREYLKVWLGPMQGMKIDRYVDPKNPADEAEAVRLRAFAATSPGFKRIAIPAVFNGLKYPFYVYITEVPWPKDPLEDQARWLEEERGGTIPGDVRESFRRLHALAHERKVSFQDLCISELDTIPKLVAPVNKSDENPAAQAAQKKLLAEVADLAERAEKSPTDDGLQADLGVAYKRLGESLASATGTNAEAALQLEKSRRVFEALSRKHPDDTMYRESLGLVNAALSRSYRVSFDYGKHPEFLDRALAAAYRRLDIFESLSTSGPQLGAWQKQAIEGLTDVADILAYADRPAEAAIWYVKALRRGSADATKALAFLYEKAPEIAPTLPADLRDLLAAARETAQKDGMSIGDVFTESLAKADREKAQREAEEAGKRRNERLAELSELADQYRSLARSNRELGKSNDALALFQKEFDTHGQQVALDTTNSRFERAQAEAALEVGKLQEASGQAVDAVASLKKAMDLGSEEAAFTLAKWYESGEHRPRDLAAATRYRSFGHAIRATRFWLEQRYEDALPDLKAVTGLSRTPDAFNQLGMCYGKLGRWDEAIAAYKGSVDLDIKSTQATSRVLNLVEAFIMAERPAEFLSFEQELQKRGWRLPWFGTNANRDWALYYGYRAMALRMKGEDASDAEREMRRVTSKPDFRLTGWSWDEMDAWLKTTRLAPDRRAAVEKLVAELKGGPSAEAKP